MWRRYSLLFFVFGLWLFCSGASVQWNASIVDAEHGPAVGYRIYYGYASDQLTTEHDVGAALRFDIPEEWPAGEYYFGVKAYNSGGESDWGTTDTGQTWVSYVKSDPTVEPPSPATNLQITWEQIQEPSMTVLGPLNCTDDGYEFNADGGPSYDEHYSGDLYAGYYAPYGADEHACFTFTIPSGGAVPSGATITKAYFRARCTYADANVYIGVRVENACPATAWGLAHRPSTHVTWVNARTPTARTLSASTWYFGESDTYATDLTSDFQTLLATGSGFEVGDTINICLFGPTSGSTAESGWYAEESGSTYLAQLTIEYSTGDASAVPVSSRYGGMDVRGDRIGGLF